MTPLDGAAIVPPDRLDQEGNNVKLPFLVLSSLLVAAFPAVASAQGKPTEATLELYKTKCQACHGSTASRRSRS